MNNEELRALAEEATGGAWGVDGGTVVLSLAPWPMEHGPSWQDWEAKGGEPLGRFVAETRTADEEGEANAAWIAAASPDRVLALLDEVERLKREIASLKETAYGED